MIITTEDRPNYSDLLWIFLPPLLLLLLLLLQQLFLSIELCRLWALVIFNLQLRSFLIDFKVFIFLQDLCPLAQPQLWSQSQLLLAPAAAATAKSSIAIAIAITITITFSSGISSHFASSRESSSHFNSSSSSYSITNSFPFLYDRFFYVFFVFFF